MKIEANKLVTFKLGDDLFAADIFAVERVLRYTAPTSVPDMPEYIEGVIDYQGRVVPIVNLRRRFEMPHVDVRNETRIL
ncbi:MAG: chemotaxis protein CheW, partial [Gemmatimonadetes bacterium]